MIFERQSMVHVPLVVLVFVVCYIGITGRPPHKPPKINGWLLLHHLLGISFPYEPSSDVVSGFNEPFETPPFTALFWSEWSAWPTCPTTEQPCRPGSPVQEHMLRRTRVCQREALHSEPQTTRSDPAQNIWLEAAQRRRPCLSEHARETETQFCPPTPNCSTVDASSMLPNITTDLFDVSSPVVDQTESIQEEEISTVMRHDPMVPEQREAINVPEDAWNPWELIVPCRPLMLELDQLPDGFAWDYLLQYMNQPKGSRCEPGLEIQRRECKAAAVEKGTCGWTQSNGRTGKYELRHRHCWIDEQCLSLGKLLEGPLACDFRTFLSESRLHIRWYRAPYGKLPTGYTVELMPIEIFLPRGQSSPRQMRNVSLQEPLDPWGEEYTVNLYDLKIGRRYEVSVGAVHTNRKISSSKSCQASLIIGAGDGAWSDWSPWSPCSSRCASVPGTRSRTRKCDSPEPSNNGRHCSGLPEMQVVCYGDNFHC